MEKKVGQYASTPSNVDVGRRNTVWGGESAPNSGSQLNVVREEEELLRPASPQPAPAATSGAKLARSMSTRSLGLRADVPFEVDTARSSVAALLSECESLIAVPASAASTVTLFDFEGGMESGPQAESTPHTSLSQKPTRKQPPPPLPLPSQTTAPTHRRSSIVYIRSEEPTPAPPASADPPSAASNATRFAQWSTRAVRPLIPKASKLQHITSSPSGTGPGSPGGGLRPLALLQERNANAGSTSPSGTRPLTLGKKERANMTVLHDENSNVMPSARAKNMKPLRLARSETAKMRGVLRKEEVLPDVVVRPPSTSEHNGFAYSFR